MHPGAPSSTSSSASVSADTAIPVGPRNLTKCTVRPATVDGCSAVVKTVRGRAWPCRLGPARWLLRREARVLAHLAPLGIAPRVLRDEGDTLVLEHIPGRTLSDLRNEGIPPDVAKALMAALARLHQAGYAHGDLGRRDVFVLPDGTVRLIDFATCIGPGLPPAVGSLLVGLAQRWDRARARKMIARSVSRWRRSADGQVASPPAVRGGVARHGGSSRSRTAP